MPNWVTNVVTVTKNIEEFKKRVINTDNEFDFNLIIPMPEDLMITSGSDSYHFLEDERIRKVIIDSYSDTDTQETFVDKVLRNLIKAGINYSETEELKNRELERISNQAKGYFNLQRYGYEDWYNFNNQNWGTKWNASDTYVSETDSEFKVSFNTAWSTPLGIWEKLCEDFDFKVLYADEDLGSNLGILEANNGQLFEIDDMNNFSDNQLVLSALCIKNNTILSKEELKEILEEYEMETSINEKEINEVKEVIEPLLL